MPSFETPGSVALDVDIPSGAVTVRTWDEPRVDVEVTPGRGDDASRQAAADIRVEVVERSGRHEVVIKAPKREGRFGFLGRGPELDVAIRCPEGADLDLTSHSADLDVRGRLGDVVARSASGDATIADARSVTFTTASGDFSAGAIEGSLNVKSASGDIFVRSVGGTASAGSVSGDIRIGETDGVATANSVSGDIELEAAGSGARVNSVSGDVRVASRPGLALWIDVQSVSGSVSSDLDVGDTPEGEAESAELRIRTVSGDVRITRAAARVG